MSSTKSLHIYETSASYKNSDKEDDRRASFWYRLRNELGMDRHIISAWPWWIHLLAASLGLLIAFFTLTTII